MSVEVLESKHRPWLAHYPPQVAPHVEHRPSYLHELLPRAAQAYPQRDALVFAVGAAGRVFRSSLSYAKLDALVERFAASLQRHGIQRGDRVAICMPNCPQFVIAFLGAARAGAIAVPFNPLYSAREAEHLLADCGAKLAVTLTQFYPMIKKAQPRTAVQRVIVSQVKEQFPAALWLLFTLTQERKQEPVRLAAEDLWFRDLLGPGTPAPIEVASEEETAVLLYTGGTTGISKGVELSHRNLVFNAEQNRAWASIGAGCETTLVALPLFHAFALTCGLNLGLLTGATLILVPNPRDVRSLAKTIHQLRPTVFPIVPTLMVAMNHLPDLARFDLRSVRVCPCAGMPLASAVQRTFIERTGIQVVEGYGLTEAGPTTHGNPPLGDDRHGTVGVPYPDTEARVVDAETGQRDMPFDGDWTQPGELIVRGPQVMKGYWNRPEESAAQLRDGWLHTGDIAQMHRDGYFRIVDRLKDLVIRGGLNVYPAEVEAVLHEHPKVLEALVIGVPDELLGERVKAFVVPRPGVELTADELLAFCRDNLARYKVPELVEFRKELQKSAVGKPLRRALREELAAAGGKS